MASAASAQAQKVYWIGRHAAVPELGSPISKVHKEGLQLLRSLGWAQVGCLECILIASSAASSSSSRALCTMSACST
jgi:hypothetical protein